MQKNTTIQASRRQRTRSHFSVPIFSMPSDNANTLFLQNHNNQNLKYPHTHIKCLINCKVGIVYIENLSGLYTRRLKLPIFIGCLTDIGRIAIANVIGCKLTKTYSQNSVTGSTAMAVPFNILRSIKVMFLPRAMRTSS